MVKFLDTCKREVGNTHDPSSVVITKGTTGIVVGHVPRVVSPICSIFIRQRGTISCRVNGSQRYSLDLQYSSHLSLHSRVVNTRVFFNFCHVSSQSTHVTQNGKRKQPHVLTAGLVSKRNDTWIIHEY